MTEPRDLPQLIEAVKAANNWSDEDIAGRARARGYDLSKQNVSRLRNEPLHRIHADTMRTLSVALGVDLVDVVRAALISAGLPDVIGEGTSAEWAIQHDPAVPQHMRRVLLTLLADARGETVDGRADFAIAAHEEPGAKGDGEQRARRRPRRQDTGR